MEKGMTTTTTTENILLAMMDPKGKGIKFLGGHES